MTSYTFKQRVLAARIEKFLKKKLKKLPKNSMVGTSLGQWVKDTLKNNPKFDKVADVDVVGGENGSYSLSITFK